MQSLIFHLITAFGTYYLLVPYVLAIVALIIILLGFFYIKDSLLISKKILGGLLMLCGLGAGIFYVRDAVVQVQQNQQIAAQTVRLQKNLSLVTQKRSAPRIAKTLQHNFAQHPLWQTVYLKTTDNAEVKYLGTNNGRYYFKLHDKFYGTERVKFKTNVYTARYVIKQYQLQEIKSGNYYDRLPYDQILEIPLLQQNQPLNLHQIDVNHIINADRSTVVLH